jgi:hypothetical protein
MMVATFVVASLIASLTLVAGASSHSAPDRLSRGSVVLGSSRFAPYGSGWGTVVPRKIYNGGDPSGLVTKIHWRHWGHRVARGHGRNAIFKPHGGYYRHPARIKLKAHKLGHCPHSRHLAYKKLSVKIPKKPGGPYGHWRSWSGSKSICRPPY